MFSCLGTNIHDALKTAIEIAKRGVSSKAAKPDIRTVAAEPVEASDDKLAAADVAKEKPAENKDSIAAADKPVKETSDVSNQESPQPIIIFLTDGEPTVGETRLHKIQAAVNEFNSPPKATIFRFG